MIRVLAEKNPKRPKTLAHQKFKLLRDGMPVKEYLALETEHELDRPWAKRELKHFIEKKLVKLTLVAAMFVLVAGCANGTFGIPYWLDADGKVIPEVLMHRDDRGGVERYRPDIWNRMFRP